ncbi:unnamed protein product [Haemonchus placei]|uniref:Uncharacterized protein n=1 Tax=Haemonchus placei TaxID=6290 RepID=A0A3P7W7C9_HAEPC|nr:unnamed protein product [Haemonchus placei]
MWKKYSSPRQLKKSAGQKLEVIPNLQSNCLRPLQFGVSPLVEQILYRPYPRYGPPRQQVFALMVQFSRTYPLQWCRSAGTPHYRLYCQNHSHPFF